MKRIMLLLMCAVVISCNNDDDTVSVDTNLLEQWEMQSYIFFGPQPPTLEEGDVTWSFSNISGNLTIVNNVETEYEYLPESGVYEVTILPDNVVIIEGLPWGNVYNYEIMDNQLFLNFQDDPQISDDELSMTFERL
ncbi:MAG: hypothetical protein KTR22_05635 [Flavobacteriaceae bacterium]|nr:hypothetical protein [Flavobacteriaceae bacterium]